MTHHHRPSTGFKSISFKINSALVLLFLLMLLLAALILAHNQRDMINHLVEDQVTNFADSYFDTINTLMLTGGMGSRNIARNKLIARPEILDARIIRGENVTKFYGPGLEHEKPVDDLDHQALGGRVIKEYHHTSAGRVLTLLMPLRASKDYLGINCLNCHVVPEGEVLGVVRLDYSIAAMDAYQERQIWITVATNSILMLAVLLIIGVVMARMITRPLGLLSNAMKDVAEGHADFQHPITVKSRDEIGLLAGYFNVALGKFAGILENTRRQSDEANRVKTALDCVSTSVMMADQNHRIIYTNRALQTLFREARTDFDPHLAGFDPTALVGMTVDQLTPSQSLVPERQDGVATTTLKLRQRTFEIIVNPVTRQDGEPVGTALEWRDLTEQLLHEQQEAARLQRERQVAAENQRIRTALDNVSSCVMVADDQNQIIYLNRTANKLFHDLAPDFRKDLPQFDADSLMGNSIDRFHKRPEHQRQLLKQLTTTYRADMTIGGHAMRIVANPVISEEGTRLGSAVEWSDRTAEVAAEREIDAMVTAAQHGNLSRRIDLRHKEGFFAQLAMGMNELISIVDQVFKDTAHAVSQMAQGNLAVGIDAEYTGAYGQIKDNINAMRSNLASTLTQMTESIDLISTTAQEIAAGNNSLSSRTEQQAASLEETAASMEQLTSTVRNNADNAQQANQLSVNTRDMAVRGGGVVANAMQAMQAISTSSTKIAEIIGVIDEIAFQTNLLALNASVEAARAGEQGRGFAVVATEVRNLAGRSATAAKQIKELIKDSVAKVDVGSTLVHQSESALGEIVQAVRKVNQIIAEIAAASAEQSAGIDQINRAVTAMDEATQQNAALAEQTSAASASLCDKAEEIRDLMAFFKV